MTPERQRLLEQSVERVRRSRTIFVTARSRVEGSLADLATGVASALTDQAGRSPSLATAASTVLTQSMTTLDTFGEICADGERAITAMLNSLRSTLGAASRPDARWRLAVTKIRRDPAGALNVHLPAPGASVEDVNAWWTGLAPEVKEAAIIRHAAFLGRVDGIPTPVRHQCNEPTLDVEITRLTTKLEALDGGYETPRMGRRFRRKRLKAKLEGLEGVRAFMDELTALGYEVYLVDLDTTGTGTMTLAVNNPDDADRVATYVPGGGTGLAKAPGCLEDAYRLLETVERLDADLKPAPKTALVVRLYPVPDLTSLGVLSQRHANAASFGLARYQHGLNVVRDPAADGTERKPARYSVICHSYGCLLAATTAATYGLHTTAASFNGMIGTALDHASQLDIAEVLATLKPNDPVRFAARRRFLLNWAPTSDAYGADVFPSDPGPRGRLGWGLSWKTHEDYWGLGQSSLYYNAQVVRGELSDLVAA